MELRGKYNTAKIFTDYVEQTAQAQIIELCNQEFVKDSKIRIMPDCHAGAGCVIGTTMTITSDKIVPNLVGVDIGCGMLVVKLTEKTIDLHKLDEVIRNVIPSGTDVRDTPHPFHKQIPFEKLRGKELGIDRGVLSVGTLGGGNHFIEIDIIDETKDTFLVIHSGSRNIGKRTALYYQKLGYSRFKDGSKNEIIKRLKAEGRQSEIETELSKHRHISIPEHLAYVQGQDFLDYIHDMEILQLYANINRRAMADEIVRHMNLNMMDSFTTIHNYIETDGMILRKGAVSAEAGELLLIPINMRDGSLLCSGKGNIDWNYSAPHGAGRIMSRSQAKKNINMETFKSSMTGIYSTTISASTIDEAPMAYKPMHEILNNITDTVDVIHVLKPIYNYKSGE